MSEQVCEADMGGGGAAGVDTYGYPVETTGNAVLDILEHRSSTRAFARDDDGRPVAVTDEQPWEAMVWALTSEDCFFNEQSLHDAPYVFIMWQM